MAKGRGRAGTHTTLTDAARPVAEALERHGRVSRGVISARVGAKTLSVKVTPLAGALRVTVGDLAGLSQTPHADALAWRWDFWRERASG